VINLKERTHPFRSVHGQYSNTLHTAIREKTDCAKQLAQ